jgi:hypothetical protein
MIMFCLPAEMKSDTHETGRAKRASSDGQNKTGIVMMPVTAYFLEYSRQDSNLRPPA